jgi:hypothetical protein
MKESFAARCPLVAVFFFGDAAAAAAAAVHREIGK